MMLKPKLQSGFALLLTLVVISVVLAIGLSLLNITVKQFTLSATARDSELAFHAANTGVECAQAAANSVDLFAGAAPPNVDFDCANISASAANRETPDTDVYQYSASEGDSGTAGGFTWSAGSGEVCTEVDLFLLDAQSGDMSFDFASAGFGIGTEVCSDGNVCTYIFSRGYNRPCDSLSGLRVVQREITVDY